MHVSVVSSLTFVWWHLLVSQCGHKHHDGFLFECGVRARRRAGGPAVVPAMEGPEGPKGRAVDLPPIHDGAIRSAVRGTPQGVGGVRRPASNPMLFSTRQAVPGGQGPHRDPREFGILSAMPLARVLVATGGVFAGPQAQAGPPVALMRCPWTESRWPRARKPRAGGIGRGRLRRAGVGEAHRETARALLLSPVWKGSGAISSHPCVEGVGCHFQPSPVSLCFAFPNSPMTCRFGGQAA